MLSLEAAQWKALISGFTCMLIYGSSYTYGTLIPYAVSYLYYAGDTSITANSMALLLPISFLVLNIAMPLSNIKALKFSSRVTTAISISGICIAIFALSFANSIIMYALLYSLLFGACIGYGYLAPISHCYSLIPLRKGLCAGVCMLAYGSAPLLFNTILLKLVNPNNAEPIDSPHGKHFPPEVANNLPFALRIMGAIYLAIGLLGIFLMSTPKKPFNQSSFITSQDSTSEKNERKSNQEIQQGLIESQKEVGWRESLTIATKGRLWFLTATLAMSVPFGMFIAFNYKEYGLIGISDDSFLTTVGSIGACFNGLGRLFWGLMFDKFSYRVLSAALNIILLAGALLMPFAIHNQWIYLLTVALTYSSYGGNYAIYPTHSVRIFGTKMGASLYYLIMMGFSLACIIQYVARLVLVSQSDKQTGFRNCFYIFAGFNVVAILLSFLVRYTYQIK